MQPYHDRPFAIVVDAGSPNVHPQAVLSRLTVIPMEQERILVLIPAFPGRRRTNLLVVECTPDAGPWLRFLRRHKSVLSPGGGAVGNSLENMNSVARVSANLA